MTEEPPSLYASPHGRTVGSVYAHAPFCARRCFYCDFAVQVRRSGDTDAWIRALSGELAALAEEGLFELASRLETLYVGGGTPSLLGAHAMARLAGVVGRERVSHDALEWTAEANPESFTDEVALGWRRAGVNRLSLGVQSFQEPVLRWMGRLHGPEGAEAAIARARRAGFADVSVDLMFGLPEVLRRSWRADLDRVLRLGVPHVSLYGLGIEPATPLGRAVAEGREPGVDEGRYRDEFLEAHERLTGAGLVHYEVSNFALPGHASRHNLAYWTGRPYLGVGNSAHSYRHPVRRWNLRDWDAYEEVAREGRLPVAEREVLDAAATRLERVWLALRTDRGVDRSELSPRGLELSVRWTEAGWASSAAGRVRLTAEGWLLLDRLAVEMDTALEERGQVDPASAAAGRTGSPPVVPGDTIRAAGGGTATRAPSVE